MKRWTDREERFAYLMKILENCGEEIKECIRIIKTEELPCKHNWVERRILITPPEDYIQSQVSATLKECDKCGEQECIYDDEEYNEN